MSTPESQPLPTDALPTMYDLPSENPADTTWRDLFHSYQARMLDETFYPPTYPISQVFTATNLYIYYDLQHLDWYKAPDWFAVVGVPRIYGRKGMRLSYVIWQEKVSPLIVIELISPGTEDDELPEMLSAPKAQPTKWEVYEQILKIPYYFVLCYQTNKLRLFRLENDRYSEQILTTPEVWIPELQLGLELWYGKYQGLERPWLRWYDANVNWIPTPEERERKQKEAALAQLETERQQKEAALAKVALLAEKLREMGTDPDRFLE